MVTQSKYPIGDLQKQAANTQNLSHHSDWKPRSCAVLSYKLLETHSEKRMSVKKSKSSA